MVKMSFTNTQNAFDYALYMIASSYFDKAECVSQLNERKLVVSYKEQKLDRQYKLEDFCIHYMDSLKEILPKGFFNQKVKVHLRKTKEQIPTEIIFKSKNHILILSGDYSGKVPKFEYHAFQRRKKTSSLKEHSTKEKAA